MKNHPADPTSRTARPDRFSPVAVRNRVLLACKCSAIMYACAAGYGGYFVWHSGLKSLAPYMVILGLPLVAALVFVGIAAIIPNLLAPGRVTFPLNLTLPFVFGALVFITVPLFTSTGNAIIVPHQQLLTARFWSSPPILGLVGFSQAICLTAMAMLSGETVH